MICVDLLLGNRSLYFLTQVYNPVWIDWLPIVGAQSISIECDCFTAVYRYSDGLSEFCFRIFFWCYFQLWYSWLNWFANIRFANRLGMDGNRLNLLICKCCMGCNQCFVGYWSQYFESWQRFCYHFLVITSVIYAIRSLCCAFEYGIIKTVIFNKVIWEDLFIFLKKKFFV